MSYEFAGNLYILAPTKLKIDQFVDHLIMEMELLLALKYILVCIDPLGDA